MVTELQTNDQLIADFGQLYNQPRSKDEATLKRVSNFITNNRIRVEAHTALTPMRGRLYQQHRPDFILRGDLENAITADSPAITRRSSGFSTRTPHPDPRFSQGMRWHSQTPRARRRLASSQL